ncbi:MAG TPA: hypothetical protein VEN81_05225, partial [Planctomycetota bacterium]|nr:hypothetical protein [Planctomycetota bacterium]
GADLEIAGALDRKKVDLAFENAKVRDIVGFLEEFSKIPIRFKEPLPDRPITLQIRDLPMGQCLELLLLPLGFDARISSGALEVFPR